MILKLNTATVSILTQISSHEKPSNSVPSPLVSTLQAAVQLVIQDNGGHYATPMSFCSSIRLLAKQAVRMAT